MIKTIVFDWYGVCTIEPFRVTFAKELSKKLAISYDKAEEAFRHKAEDYETAKIDGELFVDAVLDFLGKKEKASEFYYLINLQPEIDTKVIELAKQLKEKYNLILYSDNYTEAKQIYNKELNGFGHYFHEIILSCDIKMRKKHQEVFDLMLEKSEATPNEIVFIDDQEKNFKLFKKNKVHCILFKNYEQMLEELKKLSVV